MRILMASTSYPHDMTDWRGRFIYNLTAALAKRGDIELHLWAPPGTLPAGVQVATTARDSIWLQKMSAQGGIARLLRTGPIRGVKWAFGLLWRLYRAYRRNADSDVVHANWLQTALPLIGTKTPLVVSVLGSDLGLLRVPGITTSLRWVFRQRKTFIAPNADWMLGPLSESFGDIAYILPVPFGVDESWFTIDRVPAQPCNWLVVTRITRKKIGTLFKWGKELFGEHRQLHLFGPMQESLELPSWITYHGPTHATELAQLWFPKATGLVTLSAHDEGRPQVMLEAMAAGLPVIASDLPAHRDIVSHRITGWIAGTQEEARAGLEWAEVPENNQAAGISARAWVREHVGTWDDCAARYVTLYRKVLSG